MPAAPSTSIDQTQEFWSRHCNPHVRIAGRDASAGAVVAAASQREDVRFSLLSHPLHTRNDDYAQIDAGLPLARDDAAVADPLPHTSYAGMNPMQRRRFANWLTAPEVAAPVAFRRLYLAWLETALFEEERRAGATIELFSLLTAGGWRAESALAQTALLAAWLAQDGALIAQAISQGRLSLAALTVAAGWLAHLGEPLDAACAVALARGWNLHAPALDSFDPENDGGLLQLRISSLASTLGADALAWALAQSRASPTGTDGKEDTQGVERAGEWLPWHSVHRNVRLLLPQFNLRAALEPRLADIFAGLPVAAAQPHPEADGSAPADVAAAPQTEWYLILEFGNSRSQHYDYVTHLARKQTGYQLLMDETRQLIHRVRFRKRHMRHFWRLWAYVENWSSTRVYVNGEEIQKWNVFPYSAKLR
ncbi:MAG: hypothetical protein HY328_07545 [Chloroflexi bacterium]|nr:hypothetical protein [Chloroflexota bacterium]